MKELNFSRKIILGLCATIMFGLFVPPTAFGQAEKFDIARYTPPRGWTKTPKAGAVSYSTVNRSKTAFSVITVYASTASAGKPPKDFTDGWDQLAVRPFKAGANPKTEIQSADGWQAVTGVAVVEIDGVECYAVLIVFSGFGKTMSVFAILNDQAYLAQLDAFTESIQLDKTKVAANPSAAPSSADHVASPGRTAADNKLLGKWGASSSGTNGLDPSQNILNSGYYIRQYTFNQDGSYSFKGERWPGYIKANEYWMTEETGTYTLAESLLTVSPKRSITTVKSREGVVLKTQSNPLEKTTYSWRLQYFAGIKETNLILRTENETRRDGTFCCSDPFANSYMFTRQYNPEWKFD